ncbi:MAG: phosphoribosyltransferase family protein [Acidimicrobiia bacterium]|nr:phosphoribosyltransferase family protein [Acidimicrobiia bacterium]
MFLPVTCPVCGSLADAPCEQCIASLRSAGHLPPMPQLDRCAALYAYEGGAAALVTALKYRNARRIVPWLARELASLVGDVDIVTWAPTTPRRRRERGFDQARLLAAAVGRRRHLPVRTLLRRLDTHPQTGRNRRERLDGPRFSARPVDGWKILLVDDVITTGVTISTAAAALRAVGAARVDGLAVAYTAHDGCRTSAPGSATHRGHEPVGG